MAETPHPSLGDDPDRLLTYADIAALAGVPERSVRAWPRPGLRVLQLGRHARVRAGDLRDWLEGQYRSAA